MSEYIGARISLVSKSDIRYVGTLHDINSENSTVALENVTSFGTEGRKGNAAEEIAPSDSIYEYIVFRGSDVKDLRIEEPAKETKSAPPPQVPNDPAILGSGRPPSQNAPNQQRPHPPQNVPQQPPFPPYGQYPPFQGQRFGPPGGFPGGLGGPGDPGGPNAFPPFPGPYGAPPPGWYPPPGQGFPNQPPGPFSPPQGPIGPPGQQGPGAPKEAPPVEKQELSADQPKASTAVDAKSTSKAGTPTPATTAAKGPPPPVESKPDIAAALAPSAAAQAPKGAPTGPKGGRIVPAVPLPSPGITGAQTTAAKVAAAAPSSAQQYQNATQAATAAVAAAMAKLPPVPGQPKPAAPTGDGMENLAKKVQEMRTDDHARRGRGQGAGGFVPGQRGGRGGRRGSGREFGPGQQRPTVEVPAEDFDFEQSNRKFNKHDLVKEAIASGSPLGTPGEGGDALNGDAKEHTDMNGTGESKADDVVIPPPSAPVYNKSTSFFDNLSSEMRDREDAVSGGGRLGGREFRSEERKKNLETFGQGSVDGYRGGFRGRGRGRGFRGGGRGYRGYGRGGGRGGTGTTAEAASG